MMNLAREKYRELRMRIRRNALVISETVTGRTCQFMGVSTVMGGIVLEKREEFGPAVSTIHRDVYCLGIPLEAFGPPEVEFREGQLTQTRNGKHFRFKLSDCSGCFWVYATHLSASNRGFYPTLSSIKEGDLIFVRGVIYDFQEPFQMRAQWVGYEHELRNLRQTRPESFDECIRQTRMARARLRCVDIPNKRSE